MIGAALCASLVVCVAGVACAQDATQPQTDAEWQSWVPTVDQVAMPDLTFTEDQEDRDNYEKYYYFNRPDTDFGTALADVRECDAHARGLYRGNFYPGSSQTNAAAMQYGALAGAAGGLIAGVMMDAIMGPAELRRKRRINIRRCMAFKGYRRFGLDKTLWEEFNFEEGTGSVAEADRQRMLAQQARVAAGPQPVAEELGL